MGEAPSFPPYRPTVGGLLTHAAASYGDLECLVTPEERLTYTELEGRSRRLAGRLAAAGVGKGTRVGILFPNGVPWVVTWAAATRTGAVVLPVNTFYTATELGRFLRHADVQVLVGVGSFLQHDYLEHLETIAPELGDVRQGLLHLPALPQLRTVLLWGESERPWATGGIGDDAGPGADDLVDPLEADVTPSDPMVMIYTSGSTAEPKGVVHSHGALLRHAHNLAAMSRLDTAARTWTPMPFFWVGGFVFTLLRHLSVGGAVITQEVFEPGAALRLMSSARATVAGASPGATKQLVEHADFAMTDLSSLTGGTLLGGLPDPTLAINSLGMTETGGPHTYYWDEEGRTGAPEAYRGTFGHPVPGVEHRIADPVTGAVLADGEEGEVLVRGYNLMLGIYKKERDEVFDADGWYHTDDRGYFRDGWFFFTGRQSDLIKSSGSNVAPAEVEAALLAQPEIKLAFVVGVPHPDRGQDVVALVVPWAGVDVDTEALRVRLKAEVSSYKLPRQMLVIGDADVPWLPSMKADRRALTALAITRCR